MASERTLMRPDGPEQMQVFCAALTGFIANRNFDGPLTQGSPFAAIQFAERVLHAYCYGKEDNPDA